MGVLFSCSEKHEFATQEELKTYLLNPDNGLTKSIKVGEVKLTATVWSKDLLFKELEETEQQDSLLYLLITLQGDRHFGMNVSEVSKLSRMYKVQTRKNVLSPLQANFQLLKPSIIQGLLVFKYGISEDITLLVQGIGTKPLSIDYKREDIKIVLN